MIKAMRWLCLFVSIAAGTSIAVPAVGYELQPFDAKSMERVRAKHAGKPFILAFWSITCEPCRAEMSDWKAVGSAHPKVPIVLVSTDSPSDSKAVLSFLARYNPGRVETWIFADSFNERLRFSVDPKWRGELPRHYFFDASHRPEGHSGRLDRARLDQWLKSTVGARKP
jgi:thiol-disulfide isomerase/thioredoxin